MKYKWLLFDADGTLFDYDRAEKFALENTFKELGFSYVSRHLEEYQRINRQIWREFEQGKITQNALRTRRFDLLFKTVNVAYNSQDFSAKYLANLAKGSFLIEGAETLIKQLAPYFKMLIITNGLQDVQRPRFRNSALSPYFSRLIISDEVGVAKPNSGIFDIAFEAMDNPARSDVIIIGDSLTSDIQGGYNYGIDTCWFNPLNKPAPQTPPCTYQIQSLTELPFFLGL